MSQWRTACRVANREKQSLPIRPNDAWTELQGDPLVICWIRISIDEASRQKDSRIDYIRHRWPLIERGISRKDCLKWMETRGHPKPPRSACVFCPYHSNREWMRLQTEEPDEFERACRFEEAYQAVKAQTVIKKGFVPYLHNSRVPLREVNFTGCDPKQLNLFQNECEGMCGV
jgi:hypothetical protein